MYLFWVPCALNYNSNDSTGAEDVLNDRNTISHFTALQFVEN